MPAYGKANRESSGKKCTGGGICQNYFFTLSFPEWPGIGFREDRSLCCIADLSAADAAL